MHPPPQKKRSKHKLLQDKAKLLNLGFVQPATHHLIKFLHTPIHQLKYHKGLKKNEKHFIQNIVLIFTLQSYFGHQGLSRNLNQYFFFNLLLDLPVLSSVPLILGSHVHPKCNPASTIFTTTTLNIHNMKNNISKNQMKPRNEWAARRS